jgi:hypothetical protein
MGLSLCRIVDTGFGEHLFLGTTMNEPIVVCSVVEPYHINRAEHLPQQLRMRSSIHGLHGSISSPTAIAVVCYSGICGLGSIEIGSLNLLNTLPFDHKSGSPESLLGLLPDINKPPIEGGSGQPCRIWIASSPRPGQRLSPPMSQNNLSSPPVC